MKKTALYLAAIVLSLLGVYFSGTISYNQHRCTGYGLSANCN